MVRQYYELLCWAALMLFAGTASAAGPAVGDIAPDFALVDQQGEKHQLEDYRGQWLVLYFYPKDDTPGCTKEACSLRDEFAAFRQLDVTVLGVSLDDTDSHEAFAKKYRLPFPLLSDSGGKVAKAYGSLGGFGPIRYAKRHTFIIAPDGRIARVWRKVSPASHGSELLEALNDLRQDRSADSSD
ncbi:Thiol peroxidase, Bcp-type [hydrothermal vent metagenome]|uniref:thioredoxin-dependent peroxiredoxin n=1 Tax=hydrothermal vent metagenome TaxID=652676 RepID=A0A3B0Y920_9ZZZZ